MEQLKIESPSARNDIQYALEAALLLGFQSESAVFPVASPDGEKNVPKTEEELLKLWTFKKDEPREGYTPADKKGPIFELDFRKERGLEYLFSRGLFLKDEDYDFLPERLDVKFLLPEDADEYMLSAACNLAFRFGMETTAYEGGILAPEGYEGNAVVFSYAEHAEVTLEELSDAVHVHIKGSGRELLELVSILCERFPLTDGVWKSWRDVLLELTDDFVLKGADGQLAYFRAFEKDKKKNYELFGSPEITEEQKEYFPDRKIYNYLRVKSSLRV